MNTPKIQRHIISLKVANRPGVLIRIGLVFSRRGYNIDSLVVSPSNDPDFSFMNIGAEGDDKSITQVLKNLNKLVDVLHATDRTNSNGISREMVLFKISCNDESRSAILQIADVLQCSVLEVGIKHIILEVTGDGAHLDGVQTILQPYTIIEMMRTGVILLARGEEQTP